MNRKIQTILIQGFRMRLFLDDFLWEIAHSNPLRDVATLCIKSAQNEGSQGRYFSGILDVYNVDHFERFSASLEGWPVVLDESAQERLLVSDLDQLAGRLINMHARMRLAVEELVSGDNSEEENTLLKELLDLEKQAIQAITDAYVEILVGQGPPEERVTEMKTAPSLQRITEERRPSSEG